MIALKHVKYLNVYNLWINTMNEFFEKYQEKANDYVLARGDESPYPALCGLYESHIRFLIDNLIGIESAVDVIKNSIDSDPLMAKMSALAIENEIKSIYRVLNSTLDTKEKTNEETKENIS